MDLNTARKAREAAEEVRALADAATARGDHEEAAVWLKAEAECRRRHAAALGFPDLL